MNPFGSISGWTKWLIIGFVTLIVVGVFINQYIILKTSRYHDCDIQACSIACRLSGGVAARIENMSTHEKDGWVDCKCVGTIGSPYFKYIPIPVDVGDAGCDTAKANP